METKTNKREQLRNKRREMGRDGDSAKLSFALMQNPQNRRQNRPQRGRKRRRPR